MPDDAVPYTMRAHLICAAYLAVHDQRTRDQFITLARAFYDIMVDASAKEREATLKLAQEHADEMSIMADTERTGRDAA